jgi:hypothetical protein
MKKWMIGVVAASAMALTGCSSTCDDLADAYESLEEKSKPCSTGSQPTAFNTNRCDQNIDKCADSEKEALADVGDCIRDLPECTPATQQTFVNALLACALAAEGKVGETCSTALGD